MMLARKLFIFLLSSFVLLSPFIVGGEAALAEERSVTAEGFAVKGSVDAVTKAKALDKAMENAVRDAVMTMIKNNVYEQNQSYIDSRIIRRAKKYVVNYRITANGWVTHLDMAGGADRNILDGVFIAGGEDKRAGDLLAGAESGLDVDKNGPFIKSINEGVVAYHVWIDAGIDMDMLKKPITSLTTIENDEMTVVSIVILDLNNFDQYNSLLKKIKKVDLVKNLSYRSFTSGRYVVEAGSIASTQVLWERLSAELGTEYIVVPSGLDSIIVKAVGS